MNIHTVQADYENPEHTSAIVDLLDVYARDPMGGGQALSDEVKSNVIAGLAQRPYAISLIAFCDNQPAGLVNAFEGFSTFAAKPLINIHDIIVAPGFRGLQISQKLLQAIELIAIKRNCCKITLEVLQGNTAAQHAYTKFGFVGYELDPKMGAAMFWQKKL